MYRTWWSEVFQAAQPEETHAEETVHQRQPQPGSLSEDASGFGARYGVDILSPGK